MWPSPLGSDNALTINWHINWKRKALSYELLLLKLILIGFNAEVSGDNLPGEWTKTIAENALWMSICVCIKAYLSKCMADWVLLKSCWPKYSTVKGTILCPAGFFLPLCFLSNRSVLSRGTYWLLPQTGSHFFLSKVIFLAKGTNLFQTSLVHLFYFYFTLNLYH